MDIAFRCKNVSVGMDSPNEDNLIEALLSDIEVDRGTIIDLVRAYKYASLLDFIPREEIQKYLDSKK